MLRHNLIIALRNFRKNKSSFLINLGGLSIGLTCVLLIYLWVSDEVGMDKFHQNRDQLYKVMQNFHLPQGISTWEITPVLLAEALEKERPEVKKALSLGSEEERPRGVLSFDKNELVAEGLFSGPGFFDVFSYPLIAGKKELVLADKNSLVISEQMAKKIFDSTENILGQTIRFNGDHFDTTFQISGIFKTPKNNSFKPFDFLVNIELLVEADEWAGKWSGDYAETFVLLEHGTDVEQFNKRIKGFIKEQAPRSTSFSLFVQKYTDKYLHGIYENGQSVGGRIAYVKLFSIIALFILLIACVNFMNLSTAQASLKAKEIGVKKTIGATRQHLMTQLLGESTFLAILAFIVAIQLVVIVLPYFNELTGKSLHFSMSINSLLFFIGIVLFTGLFSGSYSAFYLSGFNPISVLKGKTLRSTNDKWVRKGLVVFQFSLSVIFIIGVLVIDRQMQYIQTKNLGYNRDNVLSFQRPNFTEKPAAFLSEIKSIPGVVEAGSMFNSLTNATSTQSGYSWRGLEEDKKYLFKSPIIHHNLLETLDMQLLEGRSFSSAFKEERTKIIINESAKKMMGLDNPVGQVIGYGPEERQIIGVVADFNYGSIHKQIEPLIFRFARRSGNNILVKIKSGTEQKTIEQINLVYRKFTPAAYPFDFTFMDREYQSLYESENKVAGLSKYFSGLAIFISCLGLFGLAAFTAERRKKEIGIRKVLGSSVFGIIKMLSSDFLKLVGIAILIAVPLSYLLVAKWLTNFAYHIDISILYFIGPALLVLFIAWCTVSMQTIKAARINPVNCLKEDM